VHILTSCHRSDNFFNFPNYKNRYLIYTLLLYWRQRFKGSLLNRTYGCTLTLKIPFLHLIFKMKTRQRKDFVFEYFINILHKLVIF